MKVLIISGETWKDGTNGGNVLTNMFSDMDAEFAQIYCNPGKPENKICEHYYQMTDSMVIQNFLHRKPLGSEFQTSASDHLEIEKNGYQSPNNKFYSFFHNHRLSIFYAIKHILWETSNWKNERLINFIRTFNPDVIFAPSYGDPFMQKLTRFVADLTKKPVISYISDDSYTLAKFQISPVFWISHYFLRNEIRKTFPYYSLVYTMTEAQKTQCERDFCANMKILMKSVDIEGINEKIDAHDPIRIIYAGGIYLNRWKTLSALSKAIEEVNSEKGRICFNLDIYTGNEITPTIKKGLDHAGTSLHQAINQIELKQKYESSDIALHVESFDLKNRLAVRMSFSTKITDCLGSGCAVMAICDEKQGGFRYLEDNDAAICISDLKMLKQKLMELYDNQSLILSYAAKAKVLCVKNHDERKIHRMINEDFLYWVNRSN